MVLGSESPMPHTREEVATALGGVPRARTHTTWPGRSWPGCGGRHTVAVAESLTGGLVAAALTDIPGASASFRGGVVTYATELKASLLGVDRDMLAQHGAVYAPVAAAMAEGVRTRLSATYGVATTGVAGRAGGRAAGGHSPYRGERGGRHGGAHRGPWKATGTSSVD